jgi:hypothetical protein
MTTTANSSENGSPNWGAFYVQLGITGPKFLTRVPAGLEDYIEMEARGTDSFYSDSIEGTLTSLWDEDPKMAVWAAVQEWGNNVREYLDEITGPWSLIPWDELKIGEDEQQKLRDSSAQIGLKRRNDLIDELVAAAREPSDEDSKETIPDLLIQGVVQPYENIRREC